MEGRWRWIASHGGSLTTGKTDLSLRLREASQRIHGQKYMSTTIEIPEVFRYGRGEQRCPPLRSGDSSLVATTTTDLDNPSGP